MRVRKDGIAEEVLVEISNDQIVVEQLMVTFAASRPSIPDSTSSQVIAANSTRKPGSYVMNNTSQIFYLAYGAAAVLSQGVPVFPNRVFLFNTTQEIRAIQDSGGSLSLDVFEAT